MMLTLLILFMGMMKVELDVQEGFEADGPHKMMLVMDITTLFISKFGLTQFYCWL